MLLPISPTLKSPRRSTIDERFKVDDEREEDFGFSAFDFSDAFFNIDFTVEL